MERRDLIKDEIERLGKVLGKIVADLLNLKAEGNTSEGIEQAREALQKELDFDVAYLVQLDDKEFFDKITSRRNYSLYSIEQLGDIFLELGEGMLAVADRENAHLYLQKSLAIYEYITKTSATYSFEREAKVNKIEILMK